MPRFSEQSQFQGNYISVWDVKNGHGPSRVRIERLTQEQMWNPKTQAKEPKWCLWLTGWEKGLPLNKTRMLVLMETWGDDMDGSVGRYIELFVIPKGRGAGSKDQVGIAPIQEPAAPQALEPKVIQRLQAAMERKGWDADRLARELRAKDLELHAAVNGSELADWPQTPKLLATLGELLR